MEVIAPDIEDVYTKIMGGKTIECFDVDKRAEYYQKKSEKELTRNAIFNLLLDDLTYENLEYFPNEFVLFNSKSSLKSTLNNLNKTTNSFLEEKGINILHLALGFLDWIDTTENVKLNSPLVLIPLKMEKDQV